MTEKPNRKVLKKEKTLFNSPKSTLITAMKKTGDLEAIKRSLTVMQAYIQEEEQRARELKREQERQKQMAEALLAQAKEKGIDPMIIKQIIG